MGYGSRSLELLTQYFQGEINSLDEKVEVKEIVEREETKETDANLQSEDIKPRKNLPPLLLDLKDRKAERLHYLGTSFGITPQLFSFWKKSSFYPVYLRQTAVCPSKKIFIQKNQIFSFF